MPVIPDDRIKAYKAFCTDIEKVVCVIVKFKAEADGDVKGTIVQRSRMEHFAPVFRFRRDGRSQGHHGEQYKQQACSELRGRGFNHSTIFRGLNAVQTDLFLQETKVVN
jgi:hypothetical protein